jgi:predicted esterase
MTNNTTTGGSAGKPAILCLHGGGTNEAIFQIQTMRIQNALSPYFTFVFLSAPFESAPGPDVLPVFEGCGPYFRWVAETSSSASSSAAQEEMPVETKKLLNRIASEQRVKDGRGFVGVLGFSQGARLAAGLLLEQQQQLGTGGGLDCGEFAFGILCNGVCPPLTSVAHTQKIKIKIPTLHVIGLEDPWREESRKLMTDYCDPKYAVCLQFGVGHRFPVLKEDTEKVAKEILRLHGETLGRDLLN